MTRSRPAAGEVFQKLLAHPEFTLMCMVDAAKNWKKARILDQKVVLNPPEILDVF